VDDGGCAGQDSHIYEDYGADVADYPRFEYSNHEVRRAGEVIAGDLVWTDETAPKIREAFHIASNYRDSHAFPMRSLRASLLGFMRHYRLDGVAVARIKRMQAIRRKLQRPDLPQRLNQLQDLGGCRAILMSIKDANTLVDLLRERSRHELWREDPYILQPKDDGYRSHHLRYKFRGKGSLSAHDGRRIELQIRTQLQHSWATAVEAVGLFRGEDLKGGYGDSDWLRLFKLVSAEFAEAEGCAVSPGVPNHSDRVAELRDLDRKLGVSGALTGIAYGAHWYHHAVHSDAKAKYYLIKLDTILRRVEVEPYFDSRKAVASYDSAERSDNESGNNRTNVVLVEADKIENLAVAYPNYFGDVEIFWRQLRSIIGGVDLEEYTVRRQEPAPPRYGRGEKRDASWLRPKRGRRRR
jgi:ppGpp synthetase/RelA/SpoT-type nucleotidyltranferase